MFDGDTSLGYASNNDDGTWSFTSGTLIDGDHELTVVLTDGAGNTAESTQLDVEIDTTINATITINAIAVDDIVNAAESEANITITGTVGGDAEAGDTVTLTVNGEEYTGQVTKVDGNLVYSIDVKGSDLALDNEVYATVTVSDDAGNSYSPGATRQYDVDTTEAQATIDIDSITGDGIINAEESSGDITITGVVGGDAKAGDTVTLYVDGEVLKDSNNAPITAVVVSDDNGNLTFAVDVDADLLTDATEMEVTATVTGTDEAGNPFSATSTEQYKVDTSVSAPTITKIVDNSDNYSSVTLSGTGEAGATIAVMVILAGTTEAVAATIDGEPVTVIVAEDGTWSVDIEDLDGISVNDNVYFSATQTDTSGNTSESSDSVHYWHGDWAEAQTEAGDDFVLTGSGDDKVNITADDANNHLTLDGGDGTDTAVLSGKTLASVARDSDGNVVITTTDGDVVTLIEFENVTIGGHTYTVDELFTPVVELTQDVDDDGVITGSELASTSDTITATVTLPISASVGDVLTITDGTTVTTISVTQSVLDAGSVNVSFANPGSGETITVTASIKDATSGESVSGKDEAVIDTTFAETGSASSDSATTDEDTAVTIDVLANDAEGYSGTLSITDASVSSDYGTVQVVSVDGVDQLLFTPNANYSGEDVQITYTVEDSEGNTSTTTVSVDVTPVADAPILSLEKTIMVDDLTDADSGVTIKAYDASGNETTISTYNGYPSGYGVSGGNHDGVDSEIGTGESLVVSFDSLLSSVDVSFAWLNSSEEALCIFYKDGVEVGRTSVNGGSDGVDAAISLSAGNGILFDEVKFTAPESNDDFLIHSITYDKDDIYIDEGSTVHLNLSIDLSDTDGSEAISEVIATGAPEGSVITDSNGNSVTVDANGSADITGFDFASLAIATPENYNGSFTLTISATSSEYVDGEIVTSDSGSATSSISIDVTVNAVNDAPEITFGTDEDSVVVSEDEITDTQPDSASGSFSVSDVDSDTLTVSLDGPTGLTSGGEDITWSWDQATGVLTGTANGETVMTVSLQEQGDGSYSYTVNLTDAFDHSSGSDDSLSFDITVNVSDGSTSTTDTIAVTVEDDSPESTETTATLDLVASSAESSVSVGSITGGFTTTHYQQAQNSDVKANNTDTDSYTDELRWGDNSCYLNDDTYLSLSESGNDSNSSATVGSSFDVGTLTIHNTGVSSSYKSLESTTIEYKVPVTIGTVTTTVTLTALLTYSSTVNSNNTSESADTVTLSSFSSATVTVDGVDYVVTLGSTDSNGNAATSFTVNENGELDVEIVASVTSSDTYDSSLNTLTGSLDIDAGADDGVVTAKTVSDDRGVLTINADGSYTFVASEALADSVSDGSVTSISYDYTVTDSDGDSVTSTLVIDLSINEAPTTTDDSIQVVEDVAYALTVDDFGSYSDDKATEFESVTITSLPSTGTLYLDGVAVTEGQTITYSDVASGKVTYQSDTNSDADSAFSYTLSDGVSSTETHTTTINVEADADAPLVSAVCSPVLDSSNLTDLLQVGGNATVTNNVITLTEAENYQVGTAMSASTISLLSDFELTFNLNFGTKDGDGADGITFILHNDSDGSNAAGGNGVNMGVNGIDNAVAIEFDTWDNGETAENYSGNEDHTSIYKVANNVDDNQQLTAVQALANLEDGLDHTVTVSWDAETKTLSYEIDGVTYQSTVLDVDSLFGSNDVYFGFTSATGGFNNVQSVEMLSFKGEMTDEAGAVLYNLDVYTALTDTDGSESINAVVISGLPADVVLSAGTYDTTTGNWTLTEDELDGLTMSVPKDTYSSLDISIAAQSIESNGGDTAWSQAKSISLDVSSSDSVSASVEVEVTKQSGSQTIWKGFSSDPTGYVDENDHWDDEGNIDGYSNVLVKGSTGGSVDINTTSGDDFVEVRGGLQDDIYTYDGDDSIALDHSDSGADIYTGSGDDSIYVEHNSQAHIHMGAGDDKLYVAENVYANNHIKMEDGNDTVYVGQSLQADLSTNGTSDSNDSDTIYIGGNVDSNVDILTGGDDDSIYVGGYMHGNIDMGTGNDTLIVEGSVDSGAVISTGSGDDIVSLGGSNNSDYIHGDVDLGSGDDVLIIDGTISSNTRLNGGEGVDTVYFANYTKAQLKELFVNQYSTYKDVLSNFENIIASDGVYSGSNVAIPTVSIDEPFSDVETTDSYNISIDISNLDSGEGVTSVDIWGIPDGTSLYQSGQEVIANADGSYTIAVQSGQTEISDLTVTSDSSNDIPEFDVSVTVSTTGNNDGLIGTSDDSVLMGDAFGNILTGSDDDDDIFGNLGDDILVGGAGNDTLTGGYGDDYLVGGDGQDVFVLDNASTDTIADFSVTEDALDISDLLSTDTSGMTHDDIQAYLDSKVHITADGDGTGSLSVEGASSPSATFEDGSSISSNDIVSVIFNNQSFDIKVD